MNREALSERIRRLDWKKIGQCVERIARRVGEWILRFVGRKIRAFLAGAGAVTLLAMILLESVSFLPVNIAGVRNTLLIGGVIGICAQSFYKKITFPFRLANLLSAKDSTIDEIE